MKSRKGQEGQMMIEGLLLLCVAVSLFYALSNKLKDSGLITGLLSKPWANIAGMTENGIWAEPDDAARKNHPNTYGRFFTPSEN